MGEKLLRFHGNCCTPRLPHGNSGPYLEASDHAECPVSDSAWFDVEFLLDQSDFKYEVLEKL